MTPERWRPAGRQGRIGKASAGHGEADIGWPLFTGYWPNQETAFQTSQQTALQTFAVAFAAWPRALPPRDSRRIWAPRHISADTREQYLITIL